MTNIKMSGSGTMAVLSGAIHNSIWYASSIWHHAINNNTEGQSNGPREMYFFE